MHNTNCLNCGQALSGNYCVDCGQKASTHRFTLRHIFSHDLVHGLFHLDKGFPFTIKELLTRPGYSVREYIEGKRSQHFNYVTFLLLMIAFSLFVELSFGSNMEGMVVQQQAKDTIHYLMQIRNKYMKEMYMITIPSYAFASWIVFRKARQNYAEHLVMNTYMQAASLMIATVLMTLVLLVKNQKALVIISLITSLAGFLYYYWFYKQYFRPENPNRLLLTLKIWLVYIIANILSLIVMAPFFVYMFQKHFKHHL